LATVTLDADLAALAEARSKALRAREAFEALHAGGAVEQERLDEMVRAMARAGTSASEELARMAVDETGYGVYEHKIVKNR